MGFFLRSKQDAVPAMSCAERQCIVDFAGGDATKRDAAIAIHRKYIPTIGARGDVFQSFMAEVDHPIPDLLHRSELRRRVLSQVA